MGKRVYDLTTLRESGISKRMPEFVKWLSAAGAELLEPTNPWELLRFRGNGETSIIYKNSAGKITFTGDSRKAFEAFSEGKNWRANERARRKNVSPTVATIRKRDGDRCFFCGLVVSVDEESVDHLVALTHGGPNHISNFVLMHRLCNYRCGNMSAPEKIRAHVEWQRQE